MDHRRVRAIGSIGLWLAVMGLVAYGFGQVTRTEWVWWLGPLTVSLDGSLLFRAGPRGVAILSLSELPVFSDRSVPLYLVSSLVTAGVAAWGAFSGNRVALITGAALAILVRALEQADDQA